MNQFFYDNTAREKIKDLMKEGIQSQAYYRSAGSKAGFLNRVPKLTGILLAIFSLLYAMIR